MSKVILMYSGELVIIENPYFVTTFIALFAIEQKIWQFTDLEILPGFTHLDTFEAT